MRFESKLGRISWRGGRPALPERRREAGFVVTLPEVLIAVVIVALVFGGVIEGYIVAGKRTEWTGYSLAAQALSVQTLEQVRSATWDIALNKTEITNLALQNKTWPVAPSSAGTWTMTGYTTNIMDVPWRGSNYVIATNYVTISQIYANNQTNPSVQLQVVQVDTVWPFAGWGNYVVKIYTNSVCTVIAPDNRDPDTLGQ
jgi:Tfp pilus assembly protein PilV